MNWQSSSLTGKSGNQRWSISSRNILRYTPVEWRSRSPPPPPPHIPLSWIMDAARATTIIVQFVPSDEGGRSVEIEQQQDRRNKRQRQQQNCWSENKSKITMPEWVGIFYCFLFCLKFNSARSLDHHQFNHRYIARSNLPFCLKGYASDKTWALSSEENQKEFIEESSASCWCLKVGPNTINMRPTLEPFCSACSWPFSSFRFQSRNNRLKSMAATISTTTITSYTGVLSPAAHRSLWGAAQNLSLIF